MATVSVAAVTGVQRTLFSRSYRHAGSTRIGSPRREAGSRQRNYISNFRSTKWDFSRIVSLRQHKTKHLPESRVLAQAPNFGNLRAKMMMSA